VFRQVSRFAVVVVIAGIAPWLALSATLAPEHVHEADDDHPQSVAHRHVAPHEIAPHDHDGATFDHADGHVVWLDAHGVYQPGYQLPAPVAAASDLFVLPSEVVRWVATSVDATAPPHGPPRLQPSLRAPPLSPR
jgi:hypothetical protein